MPSDPEYMSNWGVSLLEVSDKLAEVIVIGPKAKEFTNQINREFLPAKIISGTEQENDQVPFEYKTAIDGKTTIYVCYDKACKLPVITVESALEQLRTVK